MLSVKIKEHTKRQDLNVCPLSLSPNCVVLSEDLTIPEHLKEVVHIDEFNSCRWPCYGVE